jgi:hypothetical protein
MPQDPFIREKFTREQSLNIEFTMRRLREPIEADSIAPVKGTVMISLHEGFEWSVP